MASQDKCCKIVPYLKVLSGKLKFLKRCSLNIFPLVRDLAATELNLEPDEILDSKTQLALLQYQLTCMENA